MILMEAHHLTKLPGQSSRLPAEKRASHLGKIVEEEERHSTRVVGHDITKFIPSITEARLCKVAESFISDFHEGVGAVEITLEDCFQIVIVRMIYY